MRLTGLDLPIKDWAREEGIADAEILERIEAAAAVITVQGARDLYGDTVGDEVAAIFEAKNLLACKRIAHLPGLTLGLDAVLGV